MNHIFISPNFPPNYKQFALRLNEEGIRVLGIGSEPYDILDPELRSALTEYYKVDNVHDYDQMLRACAFFTFKYGKIDFIESHDENSMEFDARLREDFNVDGIKPKDLLGLKSKSRVINLLESYNIKTTRGKLIKSIDDAYSFIKDNSYPVCAKPEKSLGGEYTYKLDNEKDLDDFFKEKPDMDFVMEEFIEAPIVTFDGLVDKDGNLVSVSSMHYVKGHMETIIENLDSIFYIQRNVPDDLMEIGKKILDALKLRGTFFHLEFFKLPDDSLILLDIKARPPGGLCLDAINFAQDSDIYLQYARMLSGRELYPIKEKPYYSSFVGLKINPNPPRHTINDAREIYREMIVYNSPSPPEFAKLMGEYAVILRDKDQDRLKEAVSFIIER